MDLFLRKLERQYRIDPLTYYAEYIAALERAVGQGELPYNEFDVEPRNFLRYVARRGDFTNRD